MLILTLYNDLLDVEFSILLPSGCKQNKHKRLMNNRNEVEWKVLRVISNNAYVHGLNC